MSDLEEEDLEDQLSVQRVHVNGIGDSLSLRIISDELLLSIYACHIELQARTCHKDYF